MNETSTTLQSVSIIVSLDLINALDTSHYVFIDDGSLTTEVTLKLTDDEVTENVIVSKPPVQTL